MSFFKSYLKNYNRTYSEVNMMISTENQKKLEKLCKVFQDDFDTDFINALLEEEFKKIEQDYNVNIETTEEEDLKKAFKIEENLKLIKCYRE